MEMSNRPEEVTEMNTLSEAARAIYDEALRCGADHEDALDAVYAAGFEDEADIEEG